MAISTRPKLPPRAPSPPPSSQPGSLSGSPSEILPGSASCPSSTTSSPKRSRSPSCYSRSGGCSATNSPLRCRSPGCSSRRAGGLGSSGRSSGGNLGNSSASSNQWWASVRCEGKGLAQAVESLVANTVAEFSVIE
ncbi:hypothetical protein CLOM_g22053 [Closterium sp. NIES-68]|nr:hypothetical protein CLOM_g22053 [Closterium sp. NIES-68]GJP77759.1 hypothetical protein CLOP_g8110 [Closterium sp. NIES-67]